MVRFNLFSSCRIEFPSHNVGKPISIPADRCINGSVWRIDLRGPFQYRFCVRRLYGTYADAFCS